MPDRILVVNHVGGHPDSPNDLWRRQISFRDLWERCGCNWDAVRHVWLDLPEHDFLTEHPPADVTIVHFVTDCESSKYNHVGLFNISWHHSILNWRDALLKTNSQYIHIWGNEDEINYKKLGELAGYRCELSPYKYGIDLHVYIKEKL